MAEAKKFLVNGEWRMGKGDSFESVNPADGSVVDRVYSATVQDVDDAVQGAARAVEDPSWRNMPAHQRAALLNRYADLIDRDRDLLCELQTQDNGKTLVEGYQHINGAIQKFRYCAAVCETLESTIMPPRGEYFVYKTYEPVGVVAAMTAFNSPILHEAGKIAPALAAGNAVVLKSSEFTPLIGLEYGRLALEAGVPPGIVNVVTGGAEVGAALVNHKQVNMIAFTGGTKTGRIIGHAAAEKIVPCILELGGKSPNIVFEDANIEHAIAGVIYGIFSNAGQSCIAGSRIMVQASIYDEFVGKLVAATKKLKVGSPRDASTAVAPVASFQQRDIVERFIEMGKKDPLATLLCGGERPAGEELDKGAYVAPTLFEVRDHRCSLAQEEIFGPVGVILKFENEEDLVRVANDTVFGLSLGVWTENYRKAMRTVRAIKAGTVWVNTHKIGQPSVPMGGFKESGIGRENGIDGILEYLQIKNTYWSLSEKAIQWPPKE
ncbi:aldehyde dehydrogenase [Pseudomonas fluorescens]|uniref:Aldehyde dehydrogenase AldA n=1 Tax=Pseudomonas fluorescens TaxID=294 RepID=A0A5E7CG97_PSEFL|nr:aldehyde dehydrogenase [Pseudomonas fluorescens]VVO03476.1 Putative aldehyde dehydrogenase AldA [Pseudomonas fluorescens]